MINDNWVSFVVGINQDTEFHPMYFIKEIEMKD